jgi:ribonuclease BN (tRNA processing enzyme)
MHRYSSLLITVLMRIVMVGPGEGMAQQKASSNPSSRLITLGTMAGPIPRAQRSQSANVLIVNGIHYVIDAGDGVVRRLAEAGINIRDIGVIFITHHHDDHTAGLGTLMSVAWDENRTQPINVYGPPGTEMLVKAAVQYFALSSDIRIADGGRSIPIARLFFGHDVGVGLAYQDSNLRVQAIENTHFAFHKNGPAGKSYSYRFQTPDRVIVFTGDTGPSEALTVFAKGADLLVAEVNSVEDRKQTLIADGQWQIMSEQERVRILEQAQRGHLTPEDIGKMATRANIKTVVLTHLTYRPPPNTEDYAPWADAVKKHFSGQVLIAKDLMTF